MGRGHKEVGDEIFVFHINGRASLAAAFLGAVSDKRSPFHIAGMGNGHHHIFALDQIFDIGFKT